MPARKDSRHHSALHSDEIVTEAKRLNKEEDMTYRAIGERLGVNKRTVADWCQGKFRNQNDLNKNEAKK